MELVSDELPLRREIVSDCLADPRVLLSGRGTTRLANLPKVTLILRGGTNIHFTDSRAYTLNDGDSEQFSSHDLRFLESKGNHCG